MVGRLVRDPVPISAATQSDQETGTSTTTAVTPGRQHYHPSAAKFWAFVTVSAGTPTLQTSFNVTSITDVIGGVLAVTIATDFSSASWPPFAAVRQAGVVISHYIDTQNAGSVQIVCVDWTPAASDPSAWSVGGFGDQ